MSYLRARQRGFTLVEMLVAMVLTLLLVTAIAEFYAIVGDSVKDGRAMIEMGGQLRAAVQRLKADLDLITVTVQPWTDEGSASGYFECFEGIANDYNANANFYPSGPNAGLPIPDAIEDLDGNGTPDLIDLAVTNTLGDGDDFLAFTIRSNGQPFTGRYSSPPGLNPSIITSQTNAASIGVITSQLAEVVWWVGFDDIPPTGSATGNKKWDFNEPRQVYRRQLLIRPELGQIGLDYTGWAAAQQDMMRFWQYNDVSVSIRGEFAGGSLVYRIRANSLSDLTKRENRFAHMPNQVTANTSVTPPYLVDSLFPHSAVTMSSTTGVALLLPCISAKSSGANALTTYALQTVNRVLGESQGEDIILSNALAFDVQVFDPYARVWADDPSTPTTALLPSDPGYYAAATGSPVGSLLGVGAFVDLNYYSYLIPNYARNLAVQAFTPDTVKTASLGYQPYFAAAPSVPPYMTAAQQVIYAANFGYANATPYVAGATYDTWAISYERDGVDQSGNGSYDLQTNGIDDDGNGVVDDVNERDTIPPYSQALRGLQVKIRLYEPSTRQVRQATVATDFITE